MSEPPDEALGALLLAMRGSGVLDIDVLRAIETVPREHFVPAHLRELAVRDLPVPIACGQTMASPLTIALMLEALEVHATDRVLEIGTGSGYATALLAHLAREVISFERYRTLSNTATERLASLGIAACIVHGDGLEFPAQHGRFDRILVHAALFSVPSSLGEALADGGRIVAGVPTDELGSAALGVFEREGDTFVCRRSGRSHLTPPVRHAALVL